jgi:CRP-like cAMP-binding protein
VDARSSVAEARPIWSRGERGAVLAEDLDLAERVDRGERRTATQASVARVLRLPVGGWDPLTLETGAQAGVGLLVLSGLLRRRAGWDDRHGVELLAAGDVLRPWEYADDTDALLIMHSDWRVLAPARLAVLDDRWTARMGRWPAVQGALTGRALERSRRAVTTMALTQVRQLEPRLWLLLWHLAARFGRVCPDGIRLDLPITHQTLAELAGARRPSASAALSRLARTGCLRQVDHSWILLEPPPGAAPPAPARGG